MHDFFSLIRRGNHHGGGKDFRVKRIFCFHANHFPIHHLRPWATRNDAEKKFHFDSVETCTASVVM